VRLYETNFSLADIMILFQKNYSLDKEQTSYDDLLDALRLSLKGTWKIKESPENNTIAKSRKVSPANYVTIIAR